MVLHDGPIIRSGFPRAGSPVGDQKRDEFIAAMLDIMGDTPMFVLPSITDTTTLSEVSRHGATVTPDATIAARLSTLGSGVALDFDGNDDEADTPDVDRSSFGDGAVDSPFSLAWLGTPDTDTSAQTLISKQNSTSVDEWELHLTVTNGYPTFDLIDASESAILGRSHDTAVGTSPVFLVATYDGSRAVVGMNLYKNGLLVDDGVGGTTGSYTAMENTASLVRLGTRYASSERFYNGKMGLAAIVAKAFTIEEVWAMNTLCRGFYEVALT